jgi:diacylglycerol kinase (ATP)
MLATLEPQASVAQDGETIRPDRPTMVVLNPRAAGGRAAALAEPIRDWLARHTAGIALLTSDSIERSRAALQCLPRSSRIVLIGGDGTLHHMLPVLLTHRLVLGLVPFGSGNDTARALGIADWDWPRALRLALTGQPRRMDVGELVVPRGNVPFISSLAVGFDAAVGQRAIDGPAWLSGMPRYLYATLAELAALRTRKVRISTDGQLRFEGDALFSSVLNTPSYGAGMPAVPAARVADGKLDLLIAGRFGRAGTLAMLPRLLKGRHLGHPRVLTLPFENAQIEGERDLPIAADGEPLLPLRRFEIRVRASAATVVSARPPKRRPRPVDPRDQAA